MFLITVDTPPFMISLVTVAYLLSITHLTTFCQVLSKEILLAIKTPTMGLEPTTTRITIWHVYQFRHVGNTHRETRTLKLSALNRMPMPDSAMWVYIK